MALSVCDGDVIVSINLDDQRRPIPSYSRPISEQQLQRLSMVTRMHKPYAFTINVSDVTTENALIKLYLVGGVTYVFDEPVAFDDAPPLRAFTCHHKAHGVYYINDLVGEYESMIDHMVDHNLHPTPAVTETYSVTVSDNKATLSVAITPFASNTNRCTPVYLNGGPLKLIRTSGISYVYDASCVDEGISMLTLGNVGIGLVYRPRKALLDAPNYTLRHGSARWYYTTLSILSYDERLPSDVAMVLISTAIKGSVAFNPHDGNLKQLCFLENVGTDCSHCPGLKSIEVYAPVVVDACIGCDTISLWMRLDNAFRFACTCTSVEYRDDTLLVTDSASGNTQRIHLEQSTWAHFYTSSGQVVVNGRPRFGIPSTHRCSKSDIKGTVRALCVYRSPLEMKFVELLSEYPDLILQQVSIRYRVSCKWPRRQSSTVLHRFSGLDVTNTLTNVSMLA